MKVVFYCVKGAFAFRASSFTKDDFGRLMGRSLTPPWEDD